MEHDDPIVRLLERSTVAQTLKAARASLDEPSRPFTPLDRSLFQMVDGGSTSTASRPTSSYAVEQLSFVRDTYGGRPESARSSRSSRASHRPETITEEDEGYRLDGGPDILRLDDEPVQRPSPQDSEAGDIPASSGEEDEELTPVTAAGAAFPAPSARALAKPPRPPGVGYPTPSGGAPRAYGGDQLTSVADLSPHRQRTPSRPSPRRRVIDGSPHRRKTSHSPAPRRDASAASGSTPPGSPRGEWAQACEAVIAKLQALAASKERRKKGTEHFAAMCERIWDLVADIKAGKVGKVQQYAPMLLREVMGLMDLKDLKEDAKFKLSRCALGLLQMEGATHGVLASGIQAAYLNIAQVLFKYSQREGNDGSFLAEKLFEPLLEVLQSSAPECVSNDLRVYIVGVLKNVSHDDANQKFLASHGAVSTLFKLLGSDQLTGSSKEAQLLIQLTATLRNLASHHYKQFLAEDRLNALTRVMALFPGHVELLTNIARIFSKLTLHNSACEALAKSDAHIRQISRTINANVESPPLVLRLAFVLGNLTERSDRLRVIFAFDCEGTALVPQLLGQYWQKERQLARIELERGHSNDAPQAASRENFQQAAASVRQCAASRGSDSDWTGTLAANLQPLARDSPALAKVLARHGWTGSHFTSPPNRDQLLSDLTSKPPVTMHEIDEVLVKLVRLLANIAISASAGTILASSSAVVDPLLDMLGAKRIGDSEELVLNVVAAITNLLFYDVPSNLFFQEDHKLLLCRLFRPLLLESYNVEALVETARALGNLSRHADARRCMAGLRLDEILVILLDHDDRDLVFYVCGALVNLGADADCSARLLGCCPAAQKLCKLLGELLETDDHMLQLVAVKVLTNLSLDPGANWALAEGEVLRSVLERTAAACTGGSDVDGAAAAEGAAERLQLLKLSMHLLDGLPALPGSASAPAAATTEGRGAAEGAQLAGPGERDLAGGGGQEKAAWFYCRVDGCGRRFTSEEKLAAHVERRHAASGS